MFERNGQPRNSGSLSDLFDRLSHASPIAKLFDIMLVVSRPSSTEINLAPYPRSVVSSIYTNPSRMLQEFITVYRDEIIARCRAKVAKRVIPPPSEAEINHGVPLFLDQLVEALRSGGANNLAIDVSAGQHGHDLLLKGFTVSQVVHDYGDHHRTGG
jgi:hypothetical protein